MGTKKDVFTIIKDILQVHQQSMTNFFNSTLERIDKKSSDLIGAQLAQRRFDNVVTTSLLTLSQRCDTVKNESCADVGFRRCDNVALRRY